MSKESREERRIVSVNELLARAAQLRDFLSLLSSQIDNYSSQVAELQMLANTLNNIPIKGFTGLIVLDRLNTVFIPASIGEEWAKEVIVNIGRNYYMKVTKDRALEIVNKRLNTLRKVLDDLKKQYQLALNEYNAIQQILATTYMKAEKRQTSSETPVSS